MAKLSSNGTILLWLVREDPRILVDEEDLQEFGFCNARIVNGYVHITYKKERKLLHRMIMREPNCNVDHINGIKLDNRRENLRLATAQENQGNRVAKYTSTTGYKGVTWHKGNEKWMAQCSGQFIGYFKTPEDAARAYNCKAQEVFGEFAKLNEV